MPDPTPMDLGMQGVGKRQKTVGNGRRSVNPHKMNPKATRNADGRHEPPPGENLWPCNLCGSYYHYKDKCPRRNRGANGHGKNKKTPERNRNARLQAQAVNERSSTRGAESSYRSVREGRTPDSENGSGPDS